MKIRCLNGYFMFDEERVGEVSDFISLYGRQLVSKDNYFTFFELADAPDYSLAGAPYLNAVATVTFQGRPWEVMGENELVFNFDIGELVPMASITKIVPIEIAGNYIISPGLIMPGSFTKEGSRVVDYVAWFSKGTAKFKYSEVSYV